MTKEELEKEAKEKYFNHEMADFQGFYNYHYYSLGYLESAEPREKRIAELEKENAELKEQIEKMKCCANCKHNEIIEGEEFCHASRGVCKYYSETFEDDNWELM